MEMKVLHTLSVFKITEEVKGRITYLRLYNQDTGRFEMTYRIAISKRGPESVWADRLNKLANLAIDKLQQMDAAGDVRLV
jgi:hypothetical protein